jgi:hypothetical protein
VGIEYQCDRCGSTHFVHDGPLAHYTLPDGRAFYGPYGTGWCPRCHRLSEIEKIPDSEVLQDWLSGRWPPPDDWEYLTVLLDWSRMRKSPPRCLRCGGSKFIRLNLEEEYLVEEKADDEAEPFFHPGCGGGFWMREERSSKPADKPLTAEGEPIGWRWDMMFDC